ncbi:MAG: hypothetical protein CMD33_05015 [Flavobacteriales bacterium]|nr:hypothetical protein [Flavobacteriales bacterium]
MEAMKRKNTEASSPKYLLKCLFVAGMSAVMALNSWGQGQTNWNNYETIQQHEWEHNYGSMILSDEEFAALHVDGQPAQMMPPYPQVPFEGIHGFFLLALMGGALAIYRKNVATA